MPLRPGIGGPKNGALGSLQPKSCVDSSGWDVAVALHLAGALQQAGGLTIAAGVENDSGNDGYPCLLFIKNPVPYLN